MNTPVAAPVAPGSDALEALARLYAIGLEAYRIQSVLGPFNPAVVYAADVLTKAGRL